MHIIENIYIIQNVAQYSLPYTPAKVQLLRRRCIDKKIYNLTVDLDFGSRSHETLPGTSYIMWPLHL